MANLGVAAGRHLHPLVIIALGLTVLVTANMSKDALVDTAIYSGCASGVLWYLAALLMRDDGLMDFSALAREGEELQPEDADARAAESLLSQAALNAFAAFATALAAVAGALAAKVETWKATGCEWALGKNSVLCFLAWVPSAP